MKLVTKTVQYGIAIIVVSAILYGIWVSLYSPYESFTVGDSKDLPPGYTFLPDMYLAEFAPGESGKGSMDVKEAIKLCDANPKCVGITQDRPNEGWTQRAKAPGIPNVGYRSYQKIVAATPAAAAPATGPSPSTPASSATYSASCSKCSVLNNQITCACDVLPK